jgi:hypothetical protein
MKRSAAITALLCAALTGHAAPVLAQKGADKQPATGTEDEAAPAATTDTTDTTTAPDTAAAPTTAPSATPARPPATPGNDADESSIDERDYGERRQGEERDLQYAWKTAGRHYVVPLAFVSLHGYLEGVFGSYSKDWATEEPTQLGHPGQALVPFTANSSFQYDAALFVSTDISAHTRSLIELHLVSDAAGQGAAGHGGLTFAITEASASWDLYKSYLTLGGGVYWAPFGIVNIDWLGGQGLFLLVPRASGAFPAHFNERGVRLNGSKALGKGFGVNYVASLGNGVHSFDVDGQNAYDLDNGKTVMGRVGVFPGLGPDLEIGASFGAGTLRESGNAGVTAGDVLRYPSAFAAYGLDLVWKLGDLDLRSYYILSTETLEPSGGVTPPAIARQGFVAEASYQFWVDLPIGSVRAIVPKARFDWISVDALNDAGTAALDMQTSVYSVGVDFRSAGTVGAVLGLEYHIQEEIAGFAAPLDNDRFLARLLAKF